MHASLHVIHASCGPNIRGSLHLWWNGQSFSMVGLGYSKVCTEKQLQWNCRDHSQSAGVQLPAQLSAICHREGVPIASQTYELVLPPGLPEVTCVLLSCLPCQQSPSPRSAVGAADLCAVMCIGDLPWRKMCPESHSPGYKRKRCFLPFPSLSSHKCCLTNTCSCSCNLSCPRGGQGVPGGGEISAKS